MNQQEQSAMLLRFVTEDDQQRLVAAWTFLTIRDESPAMYEQWFEIAGVQDRFQTKAWAKSLLRSGICKPDGDVETSIARVIAARMINQVGKPR